MSEKKHVTTIIFAEMDNKIVVVKDTKDILPYANFKDITVIKQHINAERFTLIEKVGITKNNIGLEPGIYSVMFMYGVIEISDSLELKDFNLPSANYPLLTELSKIAKGLW